MWDIDIVSLYDIINKTWSSSFSSWFLFFTRMGCQSHNFSLWLNWLVSKRTVFPLCCLCHFFSPSFSFWMFFTFFSVCSSQPRFLFFICFLWCRCPASLDLHIFTHTNPYSFYYVGIQFNNTLKAVLINMGW